MVQADPQRGATTSHSPFATAAVPSKPEKQNQLPGELAERLDPRFVFFQHRVLCFQILFSIASLVNEQEITQCSRFTSTGWSQEHENRSMSQQANLHTVAGTRLVLQRASGVM